MAPTILITGGAGYIGSHTVLELLAAGRHVVIVDNFCNSSPKVIERLRQLGGDGFDCLDGDVRDAGFMASVFRRYQVAGVIHFAGLKAVGESVAQPLRYYDNNIGSTLCLLQAMQAAGVTLMRGDPALVAEAIELSRRTTAKIRQNLFWAFAYNVAGIPLAALGFLNPVFAGAAMAMSSVSVMANALLLKRWKPD